MFSKKFSVREASKQNSSSSKCGAIISDNVHQIFNLLLNWDGLFIDSNNTIQIPMIQSDLPFKFSAFYCPTISINSLTSTSSYDELKYLSSKNSSLISIEGPISQISMIKIKNLITNILSAKESILFEKNALNCNDIDLDESIQKSLTKELTQEIECVYNKSNHFTKILFKNNEFFKI